MENSTGNLARIGFTALPQLPYWPDRAGCLIPAGISGAGSPWFGGWSWTATEREAFSFPADRSVKLRQDGGRV